MKLYSEQKALVWKLTIFVAATGLLLLVICGFGRHLSRLADVQIKQVYEKGGEVWLVDFDSNMEILPPYPDWLPSWLEPFVPAKFNYIYLTGPEIVDADLDCVLGWRGIEVVNLSESSISQGGIRRLSRLDDPRFIYLHNVDSATAEQIRYLESCHPKCVVKNRGPLPKRATH